MNQEQTSELNEILLAPSNQLIENRFSSESSASSADCVGGVCKGGCPTLV